MRSIFHLSFPVRSLDDSIAFYRGCLGATVGRRQPGWADVLLFGHQLTLHDKPDQVMPAHARGVRHFGAILDWDAWEAVRSRVLAWPSSSAAHIRHLHPGVPNEHVKLLLEDPDGNLIELKAYRNLATLDASIEEGR